MGAKAWAGMALALALCLCPGCAQEGAPAAPPEIMYEGEACAPDGLLARLTEGGWEPVGPAPKGGMRYAHPDRKYMHAWSDGQAAWLTDDGDSMPPDVSVGGLSWGSSTDDAKAAFGEPDAVSEDGDHAWFYYAGFSVRFSETGLSGIGAWPQRRGWAPWGTSRP